MRKANGLLRSSPGGRRVAVVGLTYLAFVWLTNGTVTTTPRPHGPVPMVGFSFSPEVARSLGQEPRVALARLLQAFHPDMVRLPVYWQQVEPSEGRFDYSSVDDLLDVVESVNASAGHSATRVVLVVGMRNMASPELHVPSWAGAVDSIEIGQAMRSAAYGEYLTTTCLRYSGEPLLGAWQIENEPLDSTNDQLDDIALPYDALADEIEMLRELDPSHAVVVTSFNSAAVDLDRRADSPLGWFWNLTSTSRPAGHPHQALVLGDVLGLDVYVVTPHTPLEEASARERIGWKSESLRYWADRASAHDKELWITEMQAAPWQDTPGFTAPDLIASAHAYAGRGEQVALLWGVEQWLGSPEWMRSGEQAFAVLRGHGKAGS
jgi:hypothetical protein